MGGAAGECRLTLHFLPCELRIAACGVEVVADKRGRGGTEVDRETVLGVAGTRYGTGGVGHFYRFFFLFFFRGGGETARREWRAREGGREGYISELLGQEREMSER